MTETRPTGEQLRFVSADTGEHILDTYLEAAEKGGRTLPDMLADIYDPDTGLFRTDLFEFRVTTDLKLQFRVGDFPDLTTGWRDVEGNPYVFFKPRGTWAPTTSYIQTDLVRYQNATYYALSSHTSASTFDATKWSPVLDDTELDAAIAAAAASQAAAATSATSAANSASTATTKASEASASASAAATSASNAATSAANALTSETNTDASEAAAATSASNAASSASTASTQASNAATSATNAANSATAAAGSASAAATSAANAATSEANADTSETNAASSASAASTSASNAASSASAASTSASNAATSATNAANSASAASTSASNAASSAASALAAEANTVAIFDQFGDQYLGPKASDPTTDNDGDPLTNGDVYWNTTNNTLRFYNGTAWVAPETVATTAATNAQTSATDAASSASAAATSASNATTSASTAATQASNASTSATNAAASETAAATSATAASGSASTATTQASNAATSATNSANSASAAASSASAAATSASNAATSEANADTSEANAASSASAAATSASAASTSASDAATSATAAANSASTAATHASNASTSATNAANSASTASTHASNAATSETNAASSAASAAAVFDSFDDRYLGAKSSNPLYDNDGNALTEGALYWNTTIKEMRLWDSTAWISLASAGGSSYLDDLADVSATTPTTGDILRFNGTDWAKYDIQTDLDGRQPIDADLTAIAAISGASGLLRKTAANTWSLETAPYAALNVANTWTADQRFGDGTTASYVKVAGAAGTDRVISFRTGTSSQRWSFGVDAVAETGSNEGSDFSIYRHGDDGVYIDTPFTIDRKLGYTYIRQLYLDNTLGVSDGGTGASSAADARTNLGLAIGSNVQAWDADLDAIAAISGTSGLLKKTAANTWSLDTTTYSATGHTHAISDVTGLQSALDGKQASGSYAASSHTHAISDVTNLQTSLDAKAPLTGTGTSGTWPISISGTAQYASNATFANDASHKDSIATRTETGFYQTSSATTAEGWPFDGTWQHLIASTHDNESNYFSMQIAGGFYSQDWYFRNTNNNGAQAWSTMLHSNNYYNYAVAKSGSTMTGDLEIQKSYAALLLHWAGAQWWKFYIGTGDGGVQMHTGRWIWYSNNADFFVPGNLVAYWSDARLKEKVQDLDGYENRIMSLRPVSFEWNEKGRERTNKKLGEREIGFIAQEVQEVCPQYVVENKTAPDEDGNNYLTVQKDQMIADLVALVQSLNKRVRELEEKVK